jgi:hypothetical protein
VVILSHGHGVHGHRRLLMSATVIATLCLSGIADCSGGDNIHRD